MAIQKVSDLPILRSGNQEFKYERVKPSLIEISYKISSDESEGVSRYQSMAITVAELANCIVSAQADNEIADLVLSGDVFLNRNADKNTAQNYGVTAKTGYIDITAFNGYALSSPYIDFNCDGFTVKTAGQAALAATNGTVNVTANANFTKQVFVPTITDQTKKYSAVNLAYLEKVMPTNQFILFETKYLDYDLSSKNWINTSTAGWLLSSDYPDAYNHLRQDWNGGTDYTVEYDMFKSMSFSAKKAKDGHIVCQKSQNSAVNDLFSKTGIAWVYVIDPDTGKFRLPRNINFVKGCKNIDNIGEYVPPTLPDHTHNIQYNLGNCDCAQAGGIKNNPHNTNSASMVTNGTAYPSPIKLAASKSPTVSPPAMQMYLYMYCS